MGIAERQKRERKRRIDSILDAAEKVIDNKGIANATMDEIARVAELGKSTIYNYFDSRQLLLAALDLRGTKIEEKGFEEAYEAGKNGLERTLKICRFYFKYAMENPVCFQAKVQMGRISPDTFANLGDIPLGKKYMKALRRIHKILADSLADGVRDGSIRDDIDPQRMSLLLWCQSNGVIEIMQNRGEFIEAVRKISPQQIEDDFFQSLEYQLTAPVVSVSDDNF
ncbi:MAG: TetR family transcriptional regulator [candidate division Zixibacteria bacterium]|nr:TetR family transcriptional regulator [candidate division Zixibacteria bacterium]